MKLAMASVAALALFGCADQPTSDGGGYLSGMRPAKPSLTDPTGNGIPGNPKIEEGMQQESTIRLDQVLQNDGAFAETIKLENNPQSVCGNVGDGCEVVAIHYVGKDYNENVDMFSSEGKYLCHIQLNENQVVVNDCGWYR